MQYIGTFLFCVLSTVAIIHVYWGAGGLWPGRDPKTLARKVIGKRKITKMPPLTSCLAVAAATEAAALLALSLGHVISFVPATLASTAGMAAALLFFGRGIAAYTKLFRKMFPEEPFATLDRRLYAPLCLIIGCGFAVLL